MMNLWTKEVVNHVEQNSFYHAGKPLQRESDNYILDIVKAESEKGSSVIDYACGTGRFLELIKAEKIKAIYSGYDSSSDMIEVAKEKFPDAVFNSSLPEKIFDIAINIDMLQHSESLEVFIAKMKEVLKVAKTAVFHFWYNDQFKYQEIELKGSVFPEIFPSPVEIINEILPALAEHQTTLKLFANCQPYKTAVIVVTQAVAPTLEVVDVKKKK